MFSRYNYSDMIKKLIYISVCMTLIVACDLEDEYEPQRPQVEDDRDDNRNIGGYVVASRVETPHENSAFLLVPHYANANGRMVLNYTVEWNAGIRHSSWVAFSWDSTMAAEETSVQRKDNFKWDVDIPRTQGSVSSTDYSKNGYDKGHICASEDCVFCQVTLSVGDGSDNRVGVASGQHRACCSPGCQSSFLP